MGLDMYAYAAAQAGAQEEYYAKADFDPSTGEFKGSTPKPKEIMYWRKHPNLHGWMERRWIKQGRPGLDPNDTYQMFNGIELELTLEDLNQLEHDINNSLLPGTTGFFFGEDSDAYYKKQDIEFIYEAKADLFCGLRVFYNSSW